MRKTKTYYQIKRDIISKSITDVVVELINKNEQLEKRVKRLENKFKKTTYCYTGSRNCLKLSD